MENTKTNVTHLCLLGDDPTANITPIIDRNIPSDRLIIAHEAYQDKEVDALTSIAKNRDCEVVTWLIPTTFSTEEIKYNFLELFEKESKMSQEIWLNASNGSKHQLLSAYEIARLNNAPIFIVEPKYDALCWLYPEKQALTPVVDKIKLHEFFKLYGCSLTSQKNRNGISASLRELGSSWLSKADKLQKGLSKLNYLAMNAEGTNFSSKQDNAMLDDESLQWLLDKLENNNLIETEGTIVHFKNEETQFFCNGGWLEKTTFGIIRGLSSELTTLQDDGHSIEVERDVNGGIVKNEFDVVALANNKLHVIECKTMRFTKGEGNKVLYKIDSLAERLGGLKARAALVTFFAISNTEKRRAAELNIEIFTAERLPDLKGHLKEWISRS